MELCPPNYGDDLQTLIVTVEHALERFYNHKLQDNDSRKDCIGEGQGKRKTETLKTKRFH